MSNIHKQWSEIINTQLEEEKNNSTHLKEDLASQSTYLAIFIHPTDTH